MKQNKFREWWMERFLMFFGISIAIGMFFGNILNFIDMYMSIMIGFGSGCLFALAIGDFIKNKLAKYEFAFTKKVLRLASWIQAPRSSLLFRF